MLPSVLLLAIAAPLVCAKTIINDPLQQPVPDITLRRIQSLLSQHLADLSALLATSPSEVFVGGSGRDGDNIPPTIPGIIPPIPPPDASACICDGLTIADICVVPCGGNPGAAPIPPPLEASWCNCDARPLPSGCQKECGGTPALADAPPDASGCNCDALHISSECVGPCSGHSAPAVPPPDASGCNCDALHISSECVGPCSGHPAPAPPTPPPDAVLCNCNAPIIAPACVKICAGVPEGLGPEQFERVLSPQHRENISPHRDIRPQQNASIIWPIGTSGDIPFDARFSARQDRTPKPRLTVRTTTGVLTTVSAEVNLASYASFISFSTVQSLGLATKLDRLPTVAQGASAAHVMIHDEPFHVIGLVTTTLSYGATGHSNEISHAFYVVAPKTADAAAVTPDLVLGIDLLRRVGGLAVKDDVFA